MKVIIFAKNERVHDWYLNHDNPNDLSFTVTNCGCEGIRIGVEEFRKLQNDALEREYKMDELKERIRELETELQNRGLYLGTMGGLNEVKEERDWWREQAFDVVKLYDELSSNIAEFVLSWDINHGHTLDGDIRRQARSSGYDVE